MYEQITGTVISVAAHVIIKYEATLVSSFPLNPSRIKARESTLVAPLLMPRKSDEIRRMRALGAKALPMLAKIKNGMLAKKIGRLPNLSESAPQNGCESA